ncbi:MAG TPA: peroxidase-related enzyme [Terracidiphilus sp.]|nr:peroxidase-related enzyme [Terracidiphilus sp.]
MSSATSSGSANHEPLVRKRAAPSSTNLPLLDELTASDEVRTLFAQYRERFARTDLPGIVLCFATSSALLKSMLEIAEDFLFGESLLDRRHKEMIATHVSRQNACSYCADSHGALLATQGGRPEMICALQEGDLKPQLFTSAELALLKFAEKVNANSPPVTRADVEAAMRAGWTEAQMAEAVHIAGLFAAFNRIANGFGLLSPYPDGL